MALQAVGTSNFLSASLGTNPIQMIGTLSIAFLAINALSCLPMAKADADVNPNKFSFGIGVKNDDGSLNRVVCDVLCEPLPGGKEDLPERICTSTCQDGSEMVKTTVKEGLKNGKWETVSTPGKVATPLVGGYIDCTSICSNPISGAGRAVTNLLSAGVKYFVNDKAGAAQAACTAILFTPAGYPGCLACCGSAKAVGVS